jgi:biotin carboxyl carrier protein
MERKLRITVDGREYSVTVEDLTEDTGSLYPTPASMHVPVPSVAAGIQAPTAPAAPVKSVAHGATGPGDIVCALGGVVDSIEVTLGQVVNEGDRVATLEAMKMKTPVIARRFGKVINIAVKVGDAVHVGQTLVTLG